MFTVVVTEKGGTKQVLELEEELISIGRVQGNEIVLPRGNVSKRHAKLELKSGQFLLTDLGSTNGTYVNGRKLKEPTKILGDDKIYIGEYILSLESDESGRSDRSEKSDKSDGPDNPLVSSVVPKPISAGPPRPRAISLPRVAATEQARADDTDAKMTLPRPSLASSKGSQIKKPAVQEAQHEVSPPQTNGEIDKASHELHTLIETVLDHVARLVKRIDLPRLPMKLDEGTAGKVRIIIEEFVREYQTRGKLPPSIPADTLRGSSFRAIVDMGALGHWLDDPEVKMIRAAGPSKALLLKETGWVEAAGGFLSEEEMAEAIRCLSAGMKTNDRGAPGVAQYRLEEGYFVFSTLGPSAVAEPSILIDKQAAMNAGDVLKAAFPPAARKIVEESIEAKAKIAVIGGSVPGRLSVVGAMTSLLPTEELLVTVENLPMAKSAGAGAVRLYCAGKDDQGRRYRNLGSLLAHASGLDAAWLVISGSDLMDIPVVLSAAAGSVGAVVDLPLGGLGQLDKELAMAMAAAGAAIPIGEAALIIDEAFDIIISLERDKQRTAQVGKIMTSAISEGGLWVPRVLFDRNKTR